MGQKTHKLKRILQKLFIVLIILLMNFSFAIVLSLLISNKLIIPKISADYLYLSIIICAVVISYALANSLIFYKFYRHKFAQKPPNISLLFKRNFNSIFYLIIKNTSNWPAYKIRFIDFPDIMHLKENGALFFNTKDNNSIKNGIELLAPSQTLEILFVDMNTVDKSIILNNFNLNIEYKDMYNKRYMLSKELDLSIFSESINDTETDDNFILKI